MHLKLYGILSPNSMTEELFIAISSAMIGPVIVGTIFGLFVAIMSTILSSKRGGTYESFTGK